MKLVRGSDGASELYGLQDGPAEDRNLFTSRREDAARLGGQLDRRIAE